MPRIAARQAHRTEGDGATCTCEEGCVHQVEAYFRINSATPFIDHIKAELSFQFSPLAVTTSKLLVWVPSVFESANHKAIIDLGEAYEDDLPSHGLLEGKIILNGSSSALRNLIHPLLVQLLYMLLIGVCFLTSIPCCGLHRSQVQSANGLLLH
ncbi:hypothetical protein DPMN_176134 [Dreissena polymorpha]|uniref:Uncharacterized protein n=1 Tax=Dreissena polymorpha TaxID=45954 RepID=A0A9D4E7V2_DREPO|nr:hypothetical protein DPMN_176134 [Dreissena polymorpha]